MDVCMDMLCMYMGMGMDRREGGRGAKDVVARPTPPWTPLPLPVLTNVAPLLANVATPPLARPVAPVLAFPRVRRAAMDAGDSGRR